ncbi:MULTISPECIES: helix-turn-helix domain-containing protein [Micromonospora]|uniref:helix-turn-helix domain-containing protein n=1 Tax=Micromonospora TaxID=1873 RepID=UPI00094555A3|nr:MULTISPECIES: helix-turn-helix domain-containing protein [Micromonospora]WFE60812.1 helix-turn-helix domain-containing protein [Micromonospora sp. WMMD712]
MRAADSRAVYTVAEVAGLLSLSLGSTYALVREGEIPARKLGGRWVIPKNRFHAWLNATDTEGCA